MTAIRFSTAAALFLLGFSPVLAQTPLKQGDYEKAITQAIGADNLDRALALADECIAAHQNAKKCAELKQLPIGSWQRSGVSTWADNYRKICHKS